MKHCASAILCMISMSAWAAASDTTIHLAKTSAANRIVELRLESLADRIADEGFPTIHAENATIDRIVVEDIDGDGRCSADDTLLIALTASADASIAFTFDDAKRSAPLIVAKPINDAKYVFSTADYSATITSRGGELSSLKNAAGVELLTLPIQLRVYCGGIYDNHDTFIDQNSVPAKLSVIKSPLRTVVVGEYCLDDAGYTTGMGPLIAGLSGRVIHVLYPNCLRVENRLVETGRNNCTYSLRCDLQFPTTVFASTAQTNVPVAKDRLPTIDSTYVGPTAQLFARLESPSWQTGYIIDGRQQKWGEFFCQMSFMDSLDGAIWLVPSDERPDVLQTTVDRSMFRQQPASLTTLAEQLRIAEEHIDAATSAKVWTMPAEVQLQQAEVLATMAQRCWTVRRPQQSQRLADEASMYAMRAKVVADNAIRERWTDPKYVAEPSSAFVGGVYWPWYGIDEKQELRAAYAKSIGIDCVHTMDVQAWPEVEEKLTAQAVDAATFEPSRKFLDRMQRHDLKAVLLTMCPMWAKWGRQLPYVAGPQDYVETPETLKQSMRWVERYVDQMKDHPAVAAYVMHNEPAGGGMDTTKPEVVASFRRWLAKEYKTIDRLNAAWRTHHASWDVVPMPSIEKGRVAVPGLVVAKSEGGASHLSDRAASYDLLRFQQACYVNYLACLTQTAVKHDPQRPTFSKVVDANLVLTYAAEPFNAGAFQHKVYGGNFYYGPQSGAIGQGIGNINFMFPLAVDMQNDATNLPVWCTEFNQGWWKPYRMGLRGEFSTQVWSAFGKGLRGLFPFAWACGQWPLFNGDDSPAPAAEAMALTYAQFDATRDLVSGLKKPTAQVAFYYARPSFYQRDLTMPSHAERLLSTPLNQLRSLYESVSLVGGMPTAFVTDERIAADALDTYKALFIVEAEYIPLATIEKLRAFVERGGTLIVVGGFARFDEYGFPHTAAAQSRIAELVGAKSVAVPGSIVLSSGRATWRPSADINIASYAFVQPAADTKALAMYMDRKTAAIEHPLGQGRVLSVGCSAGVATDAYPGATAEFFVKTLESLKIVAPAWIPGTTETNRNDLAMISLVDAKGHTYVLAVNASDHVASAWMRVPAWAATKDAAIDILRGDVLKTNDSANARDVLLRLDPYQVALIGQLTCADR